MNGDQPFFVLDADDRIAQVTEEYHESMARFLGHPLWEYLPGSEPLFRPLLEEARHTGCASSSAIFYAGGIMDVRVVPAGDSVAVYTTRRTELNVRTLATLAQSLSRIEAELAAREPGQHDRPAPSSLQALP